MNRKSIIGLALAGAIATSAAVMAAVIFDTDTGAGFVGKGDVQLVYGWNNKGLQDNASAVQFQYVSGESVETTWTCDRDAGPQTQERSNTTTTSIQGIVDSIARERNQITGFNLLGWDGDPELIDDHEGPAVGSCPTGWTAIDLVEGDPVSLGGGLQVSVNGTDWYDLQ